jgi:hypothetical protein
MILSFRAKKLHQVPCALCIYIVAKNKKRENGK